MIPTDFKHLFLRDISGGALKLYIFLGFHSKYQTGDSWYSTEQIGLFFDKDPRTIANWFKELEDFGLISRMQKGFGMKANTFLQPFGFRFDEIKTEIPSKIKDILIDVEEIVKLNYKIIMGVLLNYSFKEFTFILIYQDRAEFPCSCFYNFEMEQMKSLRKELKKYNIPIDNYDIESPIHKAENKPNIIYKHLINYLDEQSM